MGSRVQSTTDCFPDFCFLLFSMVQVLEGLGKQFINNFVFSICSCAAGFNNNNNNNNTNNKIYSHLNYLYCLFCAPSSWLHLGSWLLQTMVACV